MTTALPFLKKTPPTAGSRANAKGIDAQFELESSTGREPVGLGLNRPPASPRLYSEKVELRLRGLLSNGSAAAAVGESKREGRREKLSSTVAERRRFVGPGVDAWRPEEVAEGLDEALSSDIARET